MTLFIIIELCGEKFLNYRACWAKDYPPCGLMCYSKLNTHSDTNYIYVE